MENKDYFSKNMNRSKQIFIDKNLSLYFKKYSFEC